MSLRVEVGASDCGVERLSGRGGVGGTGEKGVVQSGVVNVMEVV